MRKIASPQDLQVELRRLLAYSQGKGPSRDVLAKGLRDLADRVAAKRLLLDPSEALEGNAVAYFYVGGSEKDGDPESISLRAGDIPLKMVEKYLEKRLGANAKVQPHGANKLICHATNYAGESYTYVTPVKVEARSHDRTAAEPKVDHKGSGDWVVYFETDSPKTIHRWHYPTKAKAAEVAKKTQQDVGGFVTVMKSGIEVLSFPK